MVRAILWKEFREQALIGLTLLVFGAGILVAAAMLADPPTQGAPRSDVIRFLGVGQLAAMMLTVTAGTVCGGALFAAEREAGTMGFLESLPASRWHIWRSKLAAGTLLAFVEIVVLLLFSLAIGVVETINWAITIAIFAALAFTWGVYGSTQARTTLGSVGVAVPSAAGAFILYYVPLAFIYQNPRTNLLQAEGGLIFLGLMFVTPLVGSALQFTRKDRERIANDPTPARRTVTAVDSEMPEPEPEDRRPPRLGIRALLWLCLRQLVKPGLVIAGFALLLGSSLLPDSIQPVMVWPFMALTAGVLAGITMFFDEQSGGAARFWGERRLPLGRFWLVKLLVHAGFALVLGVLLMLPIIIRGQMIAHPLRGGAFLSTTFRTLLFDPVHLGPQGWRLLALPLVYGFAAGQLCSVLFKKAVVAAGVASVMGGSLAAFWVPSLLAGGTRHIELWAAPVIALITGWLLFRAWSSERLATRQPLQRLAVGVAVTLLTIAIAIGWRTIEVPEEPGSEDDVAYVASLPPLEVNDPGRQFRSATERFARIAPDFSKARERNNPAARGMLEERVFNVPFAGWNPDDHAVDDWLTQAYELDIPAKDEETWFEQCRIASLEPGVGIFEHPLRTGTTASMITQANGRRMGHVLLAHGLQHQAAGKPEAFPEDLRIALALSRSLRNGSIVSALNYGNDVARASFSGADRWLGELRGRPDLLRAVIHILEADEPAGPFDPRPHFLAERFIMRDQAKAPGQVLPNQLTPPGRDLEQTTPLVDLIGTAWNVPWERERTRRLLGAGYERGQPSARLRAWVIGRPGVMIFLARKLTAEEMAESDRQIRVHRRVVLLSAAVRLYQAEKGSTPGSLQELVAAGILKSIPLDPYDDQPLRYRVSAGEVLPPQPMPMMSGMKAPPGTDARPIAAGQPIIWSVGPDRNDDGGRNSATRPGTGRSGPDLVFLVPLPPPNP